MAERKLPTPEVKEADSGEWGTRLSPERKELRALLEKYRTNPSNGSRHEEAIVEFIAQALEKGRREERAEITARYGHFLEPTGDLSSNHSLKDALTPPEGTKE